MLNIAKVALATCSARFSFVRHQRTGKLQKVREIRSLYKYNSSAQLHIHVYRHAISTKDEEFTIVLAGKVVHPTPVFPFESQLLPVKFGLGRFWKQDTRPCIVDITIWSPQVFACLLALTS